jgi:hypothetical protein
VNPFRHTQRLRTWPHERLLDRARRLQELHNDIGWFRHQLAIFPARAHEFRDPEAARTGLTRSLNLAVDDYNARRFFWMRKKERSRMPALPPATPFDDHFA